MGKVAIIGSGLIGRSWAMLFASGGHEVSLFDVAQAQLQNAEKDICEQLRELEKNKRLRGSLSADKQLQLISYTDSLADCVKDAFYVQECVPEVLDLKKKVFAQLDTVATEDMVLASSSSAIAASRFSKDMTFRHRVIVAHPVNPPYYMPLVELVPAPWTAPEVVATARKFLKDIGQSPVTLNKEVAGFVQPRIQYAVIQECLRLVSEGVVSAEGVDQIFTEGLGMRYAFMGPFETIHLNAEGMQSYIDRYTDMIYGVQTDSGPAIKVKNNPALDCVIEEMNARVPLDKLAERRKWRDQRIAALSQIRKEAEEEDSS